MRLSCRGWAIEFASRSRCVRVTRGSKDRGGASESSRRGALGRRDRIVDDSWVEGRPVLRAQARQRPAHELRGRSIITGPGKAP